MVEPIRRRAGGVGSVQVEAPLVDTRGMARPPLDLDPEHGDQTGPPLRSDAAEDPGGPGGPGRTGEAGEAAEAYVAPDGVLARFTPFLLIRAAHPRQAVLTAGAMAGAAALAGRPGREIALVAATVLVGQAILGWHNDLVDRERDRRFRARGKPVADGRLDPGGLWFVLACGVLLLVPLSVANGVRAGLCYLLAVAIGMLANLRFRRGFWSWLPWAASFALYPAFLSFGGWGGATVGSPPEPAMVALAALLGIGVHLLTALWGLVPDHEEGWTYLPLRIGLRVGAGRVLTLASVWIAASVTAMAFVATYRGLSR